MGKKVPNFHKVSMKIYLFQVAGYWLLVSYFKRETSNQKLANKSPIAFSL